jgi:selenide, water dikinase
VGFDTSDDAAVYKINDETALIFTADFFPAITDDPYMFGQIAAANALSDIYAMGGTPKLALNLFCISEKMPEPVIKGILRGGADKAFEAGAIICGGHTIYDSIPKYGLAVTGFVHPDKILRNSACKEGDVLILTKPIGSGILTTAAKADMIGAEDLKNVYQVMAFLNAAACGIMTKYEVHACTDITGFGLLGHLYEMGKGSDVSIELAYQSLPIFDAAVEYAEMGFIPAGAYSNRNFVGDNAALDEVPRAYQDILFDPQTSGGLVISVAQKDAQSLYTELCAALEPTVCGKPAIIGTVAARNDKIVRVKA